MSIVKRLGGSRGAKIQQIIEYTSSRWDLFLDQIILFVRCKWKLYSTLLSACLLNSRGKQQESQNTHRLVFLGTLPARISATGLPHGGILHRAEDEPIWLPWLRPLNPPRLSTSAHRLSLESC